VADSTLEIGRRTLEVFPFAILAIRRRTKRTRPLHLRRAVRLRSSRVYPTSWPFRSRDQTDISDNPLRRGRESQKCGEADRKGGNGASRGDGIRPRRKSWASSNRRPSVSSHRPTMKRRLSFSGTLRSQKSALPPQRRIEAATMGRRRRRRGRRGRPL